MIAAVHAAVGAALGRLTGRRESAFAVGVASHLLCDLLPHKDFEPPVEAALLALALGAIAAANGLDSPEVAGACGAVAPDLENAASRVGLIPETAMVFPTHRGESCHGPRTGSALPQGILAAACLVFVLWPRRRA